MATARKPQRKRSLRGNVQTTNSRRQSGSHLFESLEQRRLLAIDSITALDTTFSESFDAMGSSATAALPAGFRIGTDYATGTTATTQAAGTTGTGVLTGSITGGAYNFANGVTATATDRALGFLTTGSYAAPRSIIAGIKNDTASAITSLTVGWDFEKYRSGARAFDWTFFHGPSSTAPTADTGGNQSYAADANTSTIFNPPGSTAKSVTLSGLSVAPGATYYVRWTYTGVGGSTNSQGIGIDNVTIRASGGVAGPTIAGATTAAAFTTTYGTASAAQSFAISGTSLTADITATAPAGFEVSSDGTTFGSTATFVAVGGSASGSLRLRLAATAPAGVYNAQSVVLSSDGATSVTIATSASGNAVSQKALTITGLSASDKPYDGTTSVVVTGTPAYAGLVNGEVFTVTDTVTWAFPDENVGNAKTLVRTGTFGAPSANYTVTQPVLTASITPSGFTTTDHLRIVSYNVRAFDAPPGTGIGTLIAAIGAESYGGHVDQVDLLALQEVGSQSTTSASVAASLNAIYGSGVYATGSVNGASTGSGTSGVVYNTQALTLLEERAIGTASSTGGPRQTLRYKFQPVNAAGSGVFYVYVAHLKSTDTTADADRRNDQALQIRADADALPQGTSILYVGDFNLYRSSEAAYQTFLSAGNGQAFDPISRPGNWHANSSFVDIFTQAPLANAPAGFVGGGLDDRFDFQLVSGEVLSGGTVQYKPGSYRAFGNNGSVPRNGSINDSRNTALAGLPNRIEVLNLLTTVSDHLPVVADYSFQVVAAIPSIVVSPATLATALTTEAGTPSAPATFTIAGTNLTTALTVTAPAGLQVSVSADSGYASSITVSPTAGTVAETTIYARLAATAAAGTYDGVAITVSGSGATPQTVLTAASGNVVTPAPVTGDLIFSEYVEGTSSNKYIEIYNAGSTAVNLADYEVRLFGNGSTTATATQALGSLTGGPTTLAPGATLVLRNSSAALTLPAGVTAYVSGVTNFNGDDALAIWKTTTSAYVDIFGAVGNDPGSAWTSGTITTVNSTLRRLSSVTAGVTTNPSTFATLGTEWEQFAVDTASDLGLHNAVPPAPGSIAGFAWNDVDGDGTWDVGEAGAAGWTIYLDLNANGALGAGEPSTVTASDGSYSFTNLTAGTYVVRQVPQTDWEQTYPAAAGSSVRSVTWAGASALPADPAYTPALRQQQKRFVPNDPLFTNQWHLRNTGQQGGTAGEDARLVSAWDVATGAGVVIGIIDDGVQHTHPDLAAAYRADLSYDFNFNDADPMPGTGDDHGTAVAGVAAARGNNGVGVSGTAPAASIAGLRLISASTTDRQEADALTYKLQDIDIYSNSWGPSDTGSLLEAPGPLTLAAFATGVQTGRDGKGSIYVWAAGNGLDANDNSNYDGYANSRYTIAVTAVDNTGNQAWYAEPGANILVAAPSNGDSSGTEVGITTVDRTGNDGYNTSTSTGNLSNRDYTNDFGGTSSATPLVSGVVALMLEANPNLGWRDVQHVLATTARKNDLADTDWTQNGVGRWVNHKYGFGVVDAAAAVNAAKTWTNVGAEVSATSGVITVGQSIPDNNTTGITSSFTMSADVSIENVEIVFNATHASRGNLQVVLTSPSGTRSVLAERRTDSNDHYTGWMFSTVRNLGESSVGTWTLTVADLTTGTTGSFGSWQMNVYGTAGSGYVAPPAAHTIVVAAGQDVTGVNFGSRSLADLTPQLAAAGALSGVTTTYGESSGTTTITVSGTNLAGNVTATAPAGFEVSSDGTTFGTTTTFVAAGGSASGTLSVRLAAATPAGSYSGMVSLASEGATSIDVAIPESTVARRSVTVTADAKSKTVGQADPAFTFTTSPLVNDDTAATAFTGSLTRPTGETAGTYAIGQGSLAAANYTITFAGANLVINPTIQVVGAYVRGMGAGSNNWSDAYLDLSVFTTISGSRLGWQLPDGGLQVANTSTLPWNNVNRLSIRFNQPVTLPDVATLGLVVGAAGGDATITPTGVVLLDGGRIVQWSFANLASGRYAATLQAAAITNADGSTLDGEWTTGVSTFALGSGDGVAGGAFTFQFQVLVGDVVPSLSGIVSTSDQTFLRQRIGNTPSATTFRADINGSNTLTTTDVNLIRNKLQSSLAQFPAPSSFNLTRARVFALFAQALVDASQRPATRRR
jgi:subtilisin-like proprotein convertase family protein/endonuclease/exonuclease/phosphatase family metal-dependent hydrolase